MESLLLNKEETRLKIEQSARPVFIFGAGASAGYTTAKPDSYIPPTVEKLFDPDDKTVQAVLPRHAQIAKKLEQIRKRVIRESGGDLEKYLSKLYRSNGHNDTIFADILSYLEDIFFLVSKNPDFKENYYTSLIEHMTYTGRGVDTTYITFNYDTLFEKSYLDSGRDTDRRSSRFPSIANYYEKKPVILKMHGSINYRFRLQKIYNPSQGTDPTYSVPGIFKRMMENTDNGALEHVSTNSIDIDTVDVPTFHTTDRKAAGTNTIRTFSIFDIPLMLIPIHGDITPENNFFNSQISRAKESIGSADTVVAIGYRFNDEAFMKSLADIDFSNKNIIIVASKVPENIEEHMAVKNIKKEWNTANVYFFDGKGFGEFVDTLIA